MNLKENSWNRALLFAFFMLSMNLFICNCRWWDSTRFVDESEKIHCYEKRVLFGEGAEAD